MVLGLVLAAQFGLAGDQDFTVVNKTGVEINAMYVGPSSQASWGEDILGQDMLAVDGECSITFSPKEEAELWDLRVEDSDGNAITWTQLNLMEISKVTLYYDAEKGEATAEVE